ncbi:GNAT family N-acetyltransferase [Klenkia sp. LSe6-5]|uniref:GNAT family N-acetyltransferase n=1 Tax=Klenkia sesuvii TaxID=3103137 RepID=A0ABU8DRV6_9ACTN
MPVLTTDRLRLDELTDADLDDVAAMVADPAVMRFYPAPLDRTGAQRLIDRNRARYTELGFGLWAVRTHAGEFVGDCGLTMQHVDGRDEVEVGYHLRTAAQGHGYAAEAARACVQHAHQRGIERVVAIVDHENLSSQRVALRAGLLLESVLDHGGRSTHLYATTVEGPGPDE